MEIVRSTTANNPSEMHLCGTATSIPHDTSAEATSQPGERTAAARRAPTSIDMASARTRAWLMNHALRAIDAHIEFTVRKSDGEIVVQLHDKASGELLRHFPVEAFPDVAAILDRQQGALFEDMA